MGSEYMAENVKVSKFSAARKNITKFFKEIRAELKKVVWLNRQQLTNNTLTVLAVCMLIGVVIWVFDFGLGKLAGLVFTK
jgi:preprotein translocase subunit SecE